MAKNQTSSEVDAPSKGEAAAPAKAVKTIPVLRVTAKREGFRRAGYEFGAESKDIPLADLKKGQIEMLKSEPMLVCVETEIRAAE